MSKFRRWLVTILKLYIAVALVLVAVFSQPALAVIPIVITIVVLFLWWRPINPIINLLADYFSFFSIAILMAQLIGPFFALLVSLPVLLLVVRDMEVTAEVITYRETRFSRYLTPVGAALTSIAIIALVISALVGNLSLLLSSIVAVLFFAVLILLSLRGIPGKPVDESAVQQRVVAGTKTTVYLSLTSKTKMGNLLFLKSLYDWVKLMPGVLSLKEKLLNFELSFTPSLSGPSTVKMGAYVIDRWGLTQTRFELEPLHLYVIPRARYATWLAKRYLSETKAGSLPLISNIGTIRPLYGLRTGIEYYGSQLYQPGDSIKNIDWKHSIKHNKLITKEFSEFRGQPAILLINLAAADAEEADKQAYNTVVAALSLAKEQIPTSISAYNHKEVRLITSRLQPQMLVSQTLDIIGKIEIIGKPVKYLKPVDVYRLHSNLIRLRNIDTEASKALSRLLQIEFANLKDTAQSNPAFKALSMAFNRSGDQSSVVVVSPMNHDSAAISFSKISGDARGNPVLIFSGNREH